MGDQRGDDLPERQHQAGRPDEYAKQQRQAAPSSTATAPAI